VRIGALKGVVLADDGATASAQAPTTVKAGADGAYQQDDEKDEKKEFDHE
jgi:hypothetical protein